MILSDVSIKEALAEGRLAIDPLDPNDIQPASVDVHLWHELQLFDRNEASWIDPRIGISRMLKSRILRGGDIFILDPGDFVLGCLSEIVTVGDDLVAQVNGKSSLGRCGLLVHATAGFVDPGWHGRLTVELANVGVLPIALYAGMPIGQLVIQRLSTPAERPYGTPGLGSHYQGDMAAVGNRPLKG